MPVPPLWTDAYSVGHPVLDGQHRWLFSLCGRASDCARQPELELPVEVAFADLLSDLMAYSLKHMEYEEALLKECHYPAVEGHQAEHHHFVAKLTEYTCTAIYTPLDKQEIARFVWSWWSDHVLVHDMQFKECVQRHFGTHPR